MNPPLNPSARFGEAAAAYVDPLIGRSLAEAGVPLQVSTVAGGFKLRIELGLPLVGYRDGFCRGLLQHLRAAGIDTPVEVETVQRILAAGAKQLPGVRNPIAVGSGKGGVGKSTVAVNLALALVAAGARTGLLDADIYGPSQPRMLGVSARPDSADGRKLEPLRAHGLQAMSIGFLVDPEQPVVWRGPMATQALTQLLGETRWDDLDYLIIDLPPGTGDIQLSLAQRAPLAGAVVVTTPQEVALAAARKGLEMFRKVAVPILGVIENMSGYVCPHCGHEEAIFDEGGGARLAQQCTTELLGHIPLTAQIQRDTDDGRPSVVAEPQGVVAQRFADIARRMTARLAYGVPAAELPQIEIHED
ncbi:MAG: iron-sulfur cluster carrier protein ApbC [Gammaproteobacteria bacterium]|nr:iron-sulfur cluster carrier protein ApbC [Gammaproteobacteria bacterium]